MTGQQTSAIDGAVRARSTNKFIQFRNALFILFVNSNYLHHDIQIYNIYTI